jgi:hypothetical protein
MQKVRALLVLASLVASTVVLPLTQPTTPALAAPSLNFTKIQYTYQDTAT